MDRTDIVSWLDAQGWVDRPAPAAQQGVITAVLADVDLPEGRLTRARYKDTPLVLVRHPDRLYALVETCAHLGGPLADGKLEGNAVVCPWHGSRFDLPSGAVIDGPSVFPQPCLQVRTHNGQVQVRAYRAAIASR